MSKLCHDWRMAQTFPQVSPRSQKWALLVAFLGPRYMESQRTNICAEFSGQLVLVDTKVRDEPDREETLRCPTSNVFEISTESTLRAPLEVPR